MHGWFDKSSSSSEAPDGSEEQSPASESSHQFREGLGDHLKARAELLALEASEAREILIRRGSLTVAATVLLVFAYALVLVTVISLLGRWVETLSSQFNGLGWQITALMAGFLHLTLSLLLFRKLRKKRSFNLFEFTRAEIKKDGEWLNQGKNCSNANESSS